jgi:IPT/TIG domain-containing protein
MVPSAALTGSLTVTEPGATLVSSQPFKVTPQILKFSPTSGHAGTSVAIAGSAFSQATSVKFNGVSFSFTVDSNDQVAATVPLGATTGTITIATPVTAVSPQVFTVN